MYLNDHRVWTDGGGHQVAAVVGADGEGLPWDSPLEALDTFYIWFITFGRRGGSYRTAGSGERETEGPGCTTHFPVLRQNT